MKHILWILIFSSIALTVQAQDSIPDVSVRLNPGVKLFRNPSGFRGATLSDTTRAAIREIGVERVRVETETGDLGWVKRNDVLFEEDPMEFLDSLQPRERRMFIVGETVWTESKKLDDMLAEFRGVFANILRQDSLRKAGVERNLLERLPVALTVAQVSKNSAGGHGLYLKLTNTDSLAIKYVNLQLEAFNPVGDRVFGDVSGESSFRLRLIGPIEPEAEAEYDFREEPNFYGDTATCFELTEFAVDYMNGSSKDATDLIGQLLVSESETVKVLFGCPYHNQ